MCAISDAVYSTHTKMIYMKKKTIFQVLCLTVLLALVLGCETESPAAEESAQETVVSQEETTPKSAPKPKQVPQIPLIVEDIYVVEISNEGFNPKEIIIESGDSLRFVAMDAGRHWPASDIHPMHETYPGSSIGKCNSPEEEEIFDACKTLAQGQGYEFRFTEKGTWSFHDHLHPKLTGTVTVE